MKATMKVTRPENQLTTDDFLGLNSCYEMGAMEKFLDHMDEMTEDPASFSQKLQEAFSALSREDGHSMDHLSFTTYAALTEMLRMCCEHREMFLRLSENYQAVQEKLGRTMHEIK